MAPFYYSTAILEYSFGPGHPLKPERLRRTVELVGRYGIVPESEPPFADAEMLALVHDPEYVAAVERISREGDAAPRELRGAFGFLSGDNPAFAGMHEAASAYVGCSFAAAQAVEAGAAVSFGIGGGLHHARRDRAAGFCVYNDAAIACALLRRTFARVAYVDVDVHHGDGVEIIFRDDPSVLTYSIHESPRTLYPGTGEVVEPGVNVANAPVSAGTTGDIWLDAFRRTALPALERFRPEAIVLQLGTDSHRDDPLAHVRNDAAHWLRAVREVAALGVPIVALGGGGYALPCVPRMWGAAILTLSDISFADELPADLAAEWGTPTFSDSFASESGGGRSEAEAMVGLFKTEVLPRIGG